MAFPAPLTSFFHKLVCVGCNLKGDVSRLRTCYTGVDFASVDFTHVEMPDDAPEAKSLSSFVEWATGKPLDKTLQQSDWVGRPLTAAQLTYAALDVLAPLMTVAKMAREGLVVNAKKAGKPKGSEPFKFSDNMNVAVVPGPDVAVQSVLEHDANQSRGKWVQGRVEGHGEGHGLRGMWVEGDMWRGMWVDGHGEGHVGCGACGLRGMCAQGHVSLLAWICRWAEGHVS